MPGGRPALDETKRFLAKVRKVESGCHEWQAGLNRGGYGKLFFRGKSSVPAHRAAYELFVRPLSPKVHVLHKCDNRKCVNPEHLFLGGNKENIADMDAKGRRGTKCRLTADDANTILMMLAQGHSQDSIAKKFNVHQTAISRIKLGKTTFFKEP